MFKSSCLLHKYSLHHFYFSMFSDLILSSIQFSCSPSASRSDSVLCALNICSRLSVFLSNSFMQHASSQSPLHLCHLERRPSLHLCIQHHQHLDSGSCPHSNYCEPSAMMDHGSLFHLSMQSGSRESLMLFFNVCCSRDTKVSGHRASRTGV